MTPLWNDLIALCGALALTSVCCAVERASGEPAASERAGAGEFVTPNEPVRPVRKAAVTDPGPGTILLRADGTSNCKIVLQSTASPSERYAAGEFQSHFKACTGVMLPIVEGPPEGNVPMIVLGRGKIAVSLGVNPSREQLGEQGFVLRTVGPHLVIAGTARAGTLYGVRHFLTHELGVRWYAPGGTRTPRLTRIAVRQCDRLVRPAFLWRRTSYAWPGGDEQFRSRRGENSGDGGPEHPLGIQYAFDGTCHTYFRFIRPAEFFDEHPEFFSEIGGKRISEETQLCLTNPEVLDIVTERMLKRMEEMPYCRQHNFSQMDWYNRCECAECEAINAKYGTPGGTQFWFVNQLAERTAKVYPEKLIGTLAYMYTEEPPKGMVMHPNVAVWLCHMFPSCDSHPIATCPMNADYKRRATAWSRICSHLYVWHYIVDFAHYYTPFPNLRALASDMRFYRDIGVEGVYAQAMSHAGGGGEFSLLRGYYVTELMKDPGQDAEAIVEGFLRGYYGAAAEPIRRYITLLHDKVENEAIHMHLYSNPAQGYLTDEVVARAVGLFDQAEAAVGADNELLERVRVARLPLVYARLFPRNGYEIDDGRLVFRQPLATPGEAQAFAERMNAHGFRTISESDGDPNRLPLLAAVLNRPMPLITLRNRYLKVEVAPFLGGRALRIIDRETGKCATAYNTARNLMFPFCGGEESRVGGRFREHRGGGMDPASPSKQSDRSVTLESRTGNGFQMVRVLTLAPDKPLLSVKTVITNPSDEQRRARVRSHLGLDLGDLHSTRVEFTSLSGERVDKDMTDVIAGLRQGEDYRGRDCPRGFWTFTGPKGLEVTQRFDNRQTDFTWLHAYPADLDELGIELWGRQVDLEPGESVTLEHELEVRAVGARG